MAAVQYTPDEYRIYLNTTDTRHLLVEGPSDKMLFKLLLDEVLRHTSQQFSRDDIDIDSAEDFIQFDEPLGNRAKVEAICQDVNLASYADKLVGFVDREFRDFERDPELQDTLGAHKVSGRLVWSRGHSIENYLFDFGTLREPLRDFSPTPYFDVALCTFELLLKPAVHLACALSLVGDDLQKFNRIKASVDWQVLCMAPGQISLIWVPGNRDLQAIKASLAMRHKISASGLRIGRKRSQVQTSTLSGGCATATSDCRSSGPRMRTVSSIRVRTVLRSQQLKSVRYLDLMRARGSMHAQVGGRGWHWATNVCIR